MARDAIDESEDVRLVLQAPLAHRVLDPPLPKDLVRIQQPRDLG